MAMYEAIMKWLYLTSGLVIATSAQAQQIYLTCTDTKLWDQFTTKETATIKLDLDKKLFSWISDDTSMAPQLGNCFSISQKDYYDDGFGSCSYVKVTELRFEVRFQDKLTWTTETIDRFSGATSITSEHYLDPKKPTPKDTYYWTLTCHPGAAQF
jgi:hypothetical protein